MSREGEKKGGSHRAQRMEREIRDVVGTYLLGSFKGELPEIVSITRVICSADLKTARVHVTMLTNQDPGEDEIAYEKRVAKLRKAAVKELNAYAHEAQSAVAKVLQMRYTPKITYYYDEGYDSAMKVERILRDMSAAKKPAVTAPVEPLESGADDDDE